MENCAPVLVDVDVDYDSLVEQPALRLVQHLARYDVTHRPSLALDYTRKKRKKKKKPQGKNVMACPIPYGGHKKQDKNIISSSATNVDLTVCMSVTPGSCCAPTMSSGF